MIKLFSAGALIGYPASWKKMVSGVEKLTARP